MSSTMERFGPTRRGGPVFRWLGEPLAIDLANTVMTARKGERVDLLATPEDLRRWVAAEEGRLGGYIFDLAHLGKIRELRDAVRELFGATVEGVEFPSQPLEWVNAASAAVPMAPQLAIDGGGGPREGEWVEDGDALGSALAKIARSTIGLLASPEREQLRICGAPSCGMFFLGARRWCCSACGNRARAARHYQRTKASGGESS